MGQTGTHNRGMKPLMIMLTYNRLAATKRSLAALRSTTDLDKVDLHILDNGSTDGTARFLADEWAWATDFFPANIGCARAVNFALARYREPHQPVIKIDNDVTPLTPGWLDVWRDFSAVVPDIAMIGGYYSREDETAVEHYGPDKTAVIESVNLAGHECLIMSSILGCFVMYTGTFMERVGYLDVLAPDHLWGFADLILAEKAKALDLRLIILKETAFDVVAESLVPGGRAANIEKFQPLYKERVKQFRAGGSIYTDHSGKPGVRRE